jgi:WD40 repeat protein
MGVVYLAEDTKLKRLVALKVIKPSLAATPSTRERFLREAQLTAGFNHDHVVTIYQVGEDQGVPFLAMQLLEGESLEERLKRDGRLPLAEVRRIGREIASALHAAHERGLIHRDIKPANVWLEKRAEGPPRVKVLDFGLARSMSGDSSLTQKGAILGTPAYMAPEQGRGEPGDHAADLFSLGCVLYRMATGEPAFKGRDVPSTLLAVAVQTPRPPRELNPEVSEPLDGLIMKLLMKDRVRRPAGAREVDETLAGVEPIRNYQSPAPAAMKTVPVKPGRFAIVAAVLAAMVVLLGVIVIKVFDKDGKQVGQVTVPEGGSFATVLERPPPTKPRDPTPIPQPQPLPKLGEPLTPWSLVTRPAKIEGVLSWTIESIGHRGGIYRLAYSPDGQWLASYGEDRTIRIWDAGSGKLYRAILTPDGSQISTLAWAPDSKWLAWHNGYDLTSPGGETRIYDIASGRVVKRFEFGGESRWSPDGKTFVFADTEFWDTATWQMIHKKKVGSLFSPDSKKIASIREKSVVIWDAASLDQIGECALEKEPKSLAWMADSQRLVAMGEGVIWKIDSASGKATSIKVEPSKFGNFILKEGWSPDRKRVVIGGFLASHQFELRVIDVENGKILKHFLATQLPHNPVASVTWSPNGKSLAVGTAGDGTISVFDPESAKQLHSLQGTKQRRRQYMVWPADGQPLSIFGTGCDKLAEEGWDLRGQKVNAVKLKYPEYSILLGLSWSRDLKYRLEGGGADGKITMLDSETGKTTEWATKQTYIMELTFAPEGKILFCDVNGSLYLLNMKSGEVTPVPVERSYGMDFSPDGKMVALGDIRNRGLLRLLTSDFKKEVLSVKAHPDTIIYNLCWSPNGKLLATSDYLLVRLWNAETLAPQGALVVLPEDKGLALTADGHYRGTPLRIERDIVYVVQTNDGQQTYTPAEFAEKFGWKNDPSKVNFAAK